MNSHLRCAAHILNLVVKEGMQRAAPSITKIRNFTSHIRKSQPAFEELKRIFEMKGKPFLVPELDVPTRWNSTYNMIIKSREIREMTDILVASTKSMKSMYLTDEDWVEIDLPSFYLDPPTLLWILKNACPASVMLDPNVKSECYSEEVKQTMHRQLQGIYKKYASNEDMECVQQSTETVESRSYFLQRLRRSSDAHQTSNTLNDYLMTPLETCKTLDYWRMRMTDKRFVKLALMARDFLVAQATSVPSEHVFSIAKHTISPVRNRLDEKKVRASLCLKSWYETGLLE
ncbi:9267_t:CDS:2, partial [Paraglomus occultum]